MSRKVQIIVALAIALVCGIAAAVAIAATTGTVSVCSTAHTVAVDGVNVKTIAAQCVTKTYTVPTVTSPAVTTTVTGPTQTQTVTQTVTAPASTSSTSSSTTSSTSSSTTTTSTTTSTTPPPPPPGGAIVGIAADPKVTCAATAATASAVSSAVANAAAGTTVCLKPSTSYGEISLSAASTKTVTLDGQGDTTGDISIDAKISNLTVQGVNAQSFQVDDPSTGITFQYSTISHVAKGDAITLYSNNHGQDPNGSSPVANFTAQYDQIDHVGACLEDVWAQTGTTFTHNVCGPGLGYGDTASTDAGHYIQTGGENNITITHNAFIGPADPDADSSGIHLNVFHDWGNSNGVTFSNNLLWHDDAIGQAILFQTGHFDNVNVDNNVAVEEGTGTYAFWLDATHTGSFSNNTTVNSYWGNLVTIPQESSDYSGNTNMTAAGNLTTGVAPAGGNNDCGFSSDTTQSNNYTGDGCSGHTFNGAWQNTAYTPSLPYAQPPAGWYQPTGLTGVGYQGTVGP